MEEVFESVGVHIFRFLTEDEISEISRTNKQLSELSDSVLLWRNLLSSFNPRSNKDPQKPVRVRSIKPRPQLKPSVKKQTIESNNSKQWIFIPPDLEKQIKVITINKAGQLRKNEEFKSSCFQLLEAWSESISRTLNILESHELRGDFASPYSAIIIWKDKLKVLDDILAELNDICVAKVDAVFAGFKPHKVFVAQIERVKRQHREAKNVWGKLAKVEAALKELNELKDFFVVGKEVLGYLSELVVDDDWENRCKKLLMILVEKFIGCVEKEADLNKIFRTSDLKILNFVKNVANAFISSNLITGNEKIRPSTSYAKPVAGRDDAVLVRLLNIINVAQELHEMVSRMSDNNVSSSIYHIYAEVPVEFNIWKHDNSVFWAQLVRAFYERLNEKAKPEVFIIPDHDFDEESDHFVVASWSIN